MRPVILVAVTLFTTCVSGVRAAEPTLSGQMISMDAFGQKALQTGQRYIKEAPLMELTEWVKAAIPPMLTEIIDSKRGIGFYATLTEDLWGSHVVVMLPIADDKALIKLFKMYGLDVKENVKESIYSIVVPGIPFQLFLKTVDGYAYLSFMSAKALDDQERLTPKMVIRPNVKELFELRVSMGSIPEPFLELGQLVIKQYIDEAADATTDKTMKKVIEIGSKLVMRDLNTLFHETEQVTLRLDLTLSGLLASEVELIPKKESQFALDLSKTPATMHQFGSLWTPESVAMARFKTPLFNDELRQLADIALTELESMAKTQDVTKSELDCIRELIGVMQKTAESQKGDVIAVMRGPEANGQYSLLVAMQTDDARKLTQIAELYLNNLSAQMKKAIQPQQDKLDDLTVFSIDLEHAGFNIGHSIEMGSRLSIVFGPKGIYLAMGAKSRELITEAMNAKASKAPVADFRVHWLQVKQLISSTDPNIMKEIDRYLDIKQDDQPIAQLTVQRGKTLRVRSEFFPLFTAGVAGTRVEVPVR